MSISISGTGAITGATTSYSFDQSVSVGGTVTYEDVTNVDSVGIITARAGIEVTGGNIDSVGIITARAGIEVTGGNIHVAGVGATIGVATAYINSINDLGYPSTGPLSNRNLIINGSMQVAQRGTSFTSIANGYTLDRWGFFDGSSAVFDVVQSSTAPNGFSNSLKVDCTTTGTPTGVQEIYVEQRIEAQNLQHLQYGSSGAQSTTLSFWVRSNKTADYGLWIANIDGGAQYATTYTISSADTWEYKTIEIPGSTAYAINNDNGVGLIFRFYLGIGPTNAGTPRETWETASTNRSPDTNLGDSTSNEWLLSGVQLEVGTQATPFEHRSFGDEIAKCKRYFQKSYSYGTAVGSNTADGRYYFLLGTTNDSANKGGSVYLGTEMRVAPTTNFYNDAGTQGVIQIPASTVTPLLLKTHAIAIYVANTTSREIAGAWTADAEL